MKRKTNQLHIVLSDKEMAELKNNAKSYNLTITQYVKACCGLISTPVCALETVRKQAELENWIAEHEEEDKQHDKEIEDELEDLIQSANKHGWSVEAEIRHRQQTEDF